MELHLQGPQLRPGELGAEPGSTYELVAPTSPEMPDVLDEEEDPERRLAKGEVVREGEPERRRQVERAAFEQPPREDEMQGSHGTSRTRAPVRSSRTGGADGEGTRPDSAGPAPRAGGIRSPTRCRGATSCQRGRGASARESCSSRSAPSRDLRHAAQVSVCGAVARSGDSAGTCRRVMAGRSCSGTRRWCASGVRRARSTARGLLSRSLRRFRR